MAGSAAALAIVAEIVGRAAFEPADLVVYAVALAFYLVLSVEGRAYRPGGAA